MSTKEETEGELHSGDRLRQKRGTRTLSRTDECANVDMERTVVVGDSDEEEEEGEKVSGARWVPSPEGALD